MANRVTSDLAAFLVRHAPALIDATAWYSDRLPLRITCYLASEQPPLDAISSARCLVIRGDSVLAQQDVTTTHILPGGRRERGEAPEETLRREIGEETGWTIVDPLPLGFMLFEPLRAAPHGESWPRAPFAQVVYAARAGVFTPEARLDDGFELSSTFYPVAELRAWALTPRERLFLDAALNVLGGGRMRMP